MSDDFLKVSTPRGDGRSMTALTPNNVSVSFGSPSAAPGQDWFGPRQPLTPIAPPEVAGRAWDYVPGYNLNTQPRPYEEVPFAALRALADSYDPVRLIIERRKDQMSRLPWTIRVKHEGRGKRPTKGELSAATRERIADITDLFKRPSYDVTYRSWLRALLEDLFVLDAPALFLKHDRSGNLIALQNMDGAILKRVIDDWGRTPEPFPWSGEDFYWNGKLVTRENFSQSGFRLLHGVAYPPIMQAVLKGLAATDYTALDLLYRPLNIRPGRAYGMSPCEQILSTVAIAMRRSISQLEYFKAGNMPEAIYSLPSTWSPDQVGRFQDYWDSLYSGNLAMRRQMKFIAGDGKFEALKEPPLKSEFDEWLVRIVCFAFSYPPNAFVQLSNRSIAEQHDKTGEEEGLQSTKLWASDLFNEIIEHRLDEDELEFVFVEEDEVDQAEQSKILTRYAEDGVLSINEIRARLGEEPSDDPAASQLLVKTPTGYLPIGNVPETDPDVVDLSRSDSSGDLQKFLGTWIQLKPPKGKRQSSRIALASGITVIPDHRGWVRVPTKDDAEELTRDGWVRALTLE